MKNKGDPARIEPGYFAVLLVVFFLFTALLSSVQLRNMPESSHSGTFYSFDGELPEEGYSLVFFYEDSCKLCNKMRYNLEQTLFPEYRGIRCYEVDITNCPDYFFGYNISGVPSVLLFEGDKEITRVTGLVGENNLKRICKTISQNAQADTFVFAE